MIFIRVTILPQERYPVLTFRALYLESYERLIEHKLMVPRVGIFSARASLILAKHYQWFALSPEASSERLWSALCLSSLMPNRTSITVTCDRSWLINVDSVVMTEPYFWYFNISTWLFTRCQRLQLLTPSLWEERRYKAVTIFFESASSRCNSKLSLVFFSSALRPSWWRTPSWLLAPYHPFIVRYLS